MNLLTTLKLGCLFFLFNQSIYANSENETSHFKAFEVNCHTNLECPHSNKSHFGSATYGSNPAEWYTIETNSYPDVVLLSKNRNKGTSEGGVYLSPTGFTIGESGNYWISITAILQNPTEDSTVLIPVFLSVNDEFDPDDTNPIGGVITLSSGVIDSLHGNGVLKNVVPGTRLSLVATNAGYPFPIPVTVVGWNISVFKLP